MHLKISFLPIALTIFFSAIFYNSYTQSKNKTENVVLILIDGYRWQELFEGADKSLTLHF